VTRAVGFDEYGAADVMRIVDVEVPDPGPTQVRVRMAATPVNPADLWVRDGGLDALMVEAAWPVVPGLEGAGTVQAVGSEVSDFVPGDEVVGITTFIGTGRGAQSELALFAAADLALRPDALSAVDASTIPMNGLTATACLDVLGLEPGRTVGVLGAAGAVGGFVVQLARQRGLEVVALAQESDREALTALGASEVLAGPVAETVRAHTQHGWSAVVDAAVLGETALDAVADGGTLVVLRPLDEPARRAAEARGIDTQLVSVRQYQGDAARLTRLVDDAAAGHLAARVARTVSPAEAGDAHRQIEAGGMRGRVVLDWTRLDLEDPA
jgi:NADPH2:quinone reductase